MAYKFKSINLFDGGGIYLKCDSCQYGAKYQWRISKIDHMRENYDLVCPHCGLHGARFSNTFPNISIKAVDYN